MVWSSSVPSSSLFSLITHYFIFYSREFDSFRGQTPEQYIWFINLSLIIFTSFAAAVHYKIPLPINQRPWVGHINESSNKFSYVNITVKHLSCVYGWHRSEIENLNMYIHAAVQHQLQNKYTHNLYSTSLFLALFPLQWRVFSAYSPSMVRNHNWKWGTRKEWSFQGDKAEGKKQFPFLYLLSQRRWWHAQFSLERTLRVLLNEHQTFYSVTPILAIIGYISFLSYLPPGKKNHVKCTCKESSSHGFLPCSNQQKAISEFPKNLWERHDFQKNNNQKPKLNYTKEN